MVVETLKVKKERERKREKKFYTKGREICIYIYIEQNKNHQSQKKYHDFFIKKKKKP